MNTPPEEITDLTPWANPGIFRIECIVNNRCFFGESSCVFSELKRIRDALYNGIYENKQLLSDYKRYGANKFKYIGVIAGPEFEEPEVRQKELEKYKKVWPGKFY